MSSLTLTVHCVKVCDYWSGDATEHKAVVAGKHLGVHTGPEDRATVVALGWPGSSADSEHTYSGWIEKADAGQELSAESLGRSVL